MTEARGKESVFNGASRGRRYGGRRIERRRPISRLRAATMICVAHHLKKRLSPQSQSKRALFVSAVCVDKNTNNSFDEDVSSSSSSSSCFLPCKFWNEPPLDFFMAPICRRRRFRRWFYCAWCGASSSSTRLGTIYEMEGALFQKKNILFRV